MSDISSYDGRDLSKKRKWFKDHYQKHKEKILKYNKNHRDTYKESQMFSNAKARAKKLGLEINIDLSDIVIPLICPILGIELKKDNKKASSNSPTIDRIDNNKGYIKGNVWVISYLANTMKNNATKEELIRFAKSILNLYGENK